MESSQIKGIRRLTEDFTLLKTFGVTFSIFHYAACTVKNSVILPHFLVWKFCGKAQFPHSFGRFAQNYGETVPFHKISTPEN